MELLFIATGPSTVIELTLRGIVRWKDELFILFIASLYRVYTESKCVSVCVSDVHTRFHLEMISCVFPVAEHRSVWCGSSKISPTSRETIRPYSHKPSLSSPLSSVITEPSNSHIYNLRAGQF